MKDVLQIIYNRLGDDLSRYIFSQRIMYGLTDNYQYIFNILRKTDSIGKEFEKINDRNVVIFSAGRIGKMIKNSYHHLNVIAFVDNFSNEEFCEGVPVISFQEYLESFRDKCVLIANKYHGEDIYHQLIGAGIDDDKIINLELINKDRAKRQYFDLPFLNNRSHSRENFIDCGCFDGFSTEQFVNWCGGNYEKIWAFEPDRKNYYLAKEKLECCCGGRYELINSGVWNENTVLPFREAGDVSSNFQSNGNSVVNVKKIDDVVQGKATFIKMDIEGAEYEALQGCINIVQRYKPRLAISVYHKKDDIFRIPELILEMDSSYQLFLRHYSITEHDTILYAV